MQPTASLVAGIETFKRTSEQEQSAGQNNVPGPFLCNDIYLSLRRRPTHGQTTSDGGLAPGVGTKSWRSFTPGREAMRRVCSCQLQGI